MSQEQVLSIIKKRKKATFEEIKKAVPHLGEGSIRKNIRKLLKRDIGSTIIQREVSNKTIYWYKE